MPVLIRNCWITQSTSQTSRRKFNTSLIYIACLVVWQPRVPRIRRRIGDRAFSVAAPLAWNKAADRAETAALDRLDILTSTNKRAKQWLA